MKPARFVSAGDFQAWLESNHAAATGLTVAFHNKSSGRSGLAYPEALDEALCFGWIDGIRRKLDAARYTIRFTPRQRGSIWSLVNVRHAERLVAAGRMHPAGLAAFAARDPKKPASTPSNSVGKHCRPPSKISFAPTQKPGPSGRPSRRVTGARPFGGLSAPGGRQPAPAVLRSSSPILPRAAALRSWPRPGAARRAALPLGALLRAPACRRLRPSRSMISVSLSTDRRPGSL